MSGISVVRHVRGSVTARDVMKCLNCQSLPLSSRGKGRVLFKSALPVPASSDVTIEIPKFTHDWNAAGASTLAMCGSRSSSKVRVIYDPLGAHTLLDPWKIALVWVVEHCEDLSGRLRSWKPLVAPWELKALHDAQFRFAQAMQRWSASSPALYRLASHAEAERNLEKLNALSHAEVFSSINIRQDTESDLACCRIVDRGLAVNPKSALAFSAPSVNLIKDFTIISAVDECMQTKHDDVKSLALNAFELLKKLNDFR